MSAYLSSFLTQTTSKYNNLRRVLISSEADGDTEDDSHISRVLRAYYTEKGRPFPEWLPADPKAPPPQQAQFVSANNNQPAFAQQQSGQRWGGKGAGLSDLWDTPKQQQQQPAGTESLRPRFNGRGSNESAPAAPSGGRSGRFGDAYDQGSMQAGRPGAGPRAGSYQGSGRFSGVDQSTSPPPGSGSGNTAKDMLKAKLWGSSRTTSPTPSTNSGYGQPARDPSPAFNSKVSTEPRRYASPAASYGDDKRGYGGGNDGRAGSGPPPGQSYSSSSDGNGSSNAGGNYGGGGAYGGGPYAGGGGQRVPAGGRMGLPSGPRPQRYS